VELDDVYDECEYTGGTLEDLAEAARSEAKSLLAGEPLRRTRTEPSRPDRTSATEITGRLRSMLRRAREFLRR
jgi:hypothetical protein